MTPDEFVRLAKAARDGFLTTSFDPRSGSSVASQIAALQLDPERSRLLKAAIETLLTDVFYTWLLALDGCANLGGQQHAYVLADSAGNVLTGGEIEGAAWEAFHGAG